MEHTDVLLTLAEVSVAFAGFSGIVAVFGRRDPKAWSFADRARFYALVSTSLAAVFLAVIPFGLLALGIPAAFVWRTSSGLFAIYLVLTYISWAHQFRSASIEQRSGVSRIVAWGVMVSSVVILGINVYNAAIAASAGPFLLALILLVGQAGFYFARLLVLSFDVKRH